MQRTISNIDSSEVESDVVLENKKRERRVTVEAEYSI